MKKNKYIVHTEGYWLLQNRKCIPNLGGIFFIYECNYDNIYDIVEIKNLLYIGQCNNIREEIELVLSKEEIQEYTSSEKKLCFSYAAILDLESRDRIFNQYIYFMEPVLNEFQEISETEIANNIVITIGDVALLEPVCDNLVLA